MFILIVHNVFYCKENTLQLFTEYQNEQKTNGFLTECIFLLEAEVSDLRISLFLDHDKVPATAKLDVVRRRRQPLFQLFVTQMFFLSE